MWSLSALWTDVCIRGRQQQNKQTARQSYLVWLTPGTPTKTHAKVRTIEPPFPPVEKNFLGRDRRRAQASRGAAVTFPFRLVLQTNDTDIYDSAVAWHTMHGKLKLFSGLQNAGNQNPEKALDSPTLLFRFRRRSPLLKGGHFRGDLEKRK